MLPAKRSGAVCSEQRNIEVAMCRSLSGDTAKREPACSKLTSTSWPKIEGNRVTVWLTTESASSVAGIVVMNSWSVVSMEKASLLGGRSAFPDFCVVMISMIAGRIK